MSRTVGPGQAHCYTNPSFCRQSEYISTDRNPDELPPPPQFQSTEDLPPPSPSPPPPPPLPHPQQQPQHHQQPQQLHPQNQHHPQQPIQQPHHQQNQPLLHPQQLQMQQQQLQIHQQQQNSELQNPTIYNVGHANLAFQYDPALRSDRINVPQRSQNDRYQYLDETRPTAGSPRAPENYNPRAPEIYRPRAPENYHPRPPQNREIRSRYEYIDDDDDDRDIERINRPVENISRSVVIPNDENISARNPNVNSSAGRYGYIDDNGTTMQVQQVLRDENVPGVFTYRRREATRVSQGSRYALVPVGSVDEDTTMRNCRNSVVMCERSSSTRGRYARVPSQEILDVPILPDRNIREHQILHPDEMNCVSPKNNLATQKLHEILTTPRKPRSRSEERTLSPSKRQQQMITGIGQRGTITPTGSPSGRYASSPSRVASGTPRRDQHHQLVQVTTPRRGDLSPSGSGHGPHTSTPTKEPSARRCLPLDSSTVARSRDSRAESSCPASNCGRPRYPQRSASAQGHSSTYGLVGSPGEPPPRYAYLDGLSESIPMVSGSPRYQVVSRINNEKNVESAFIARTAVVPPLSPPNSEANTTLASGLEKYERRNAPLLLLLVGVLTCGLAVYLSMNQGRRYYLDSAAGCGACCALAGACRSLRRAWTGLGLAGLSALSCAGLLLIAAKAPRPGTPLHDVTAGALCGVSILGACLAVLALLSPKCKISRHRRVHSWIPRFSQSSLSY